MELSTFIAFLVALLLVQTIVFLLGLERLKDRPNGRATPTVTVIVAARNEEASIGSCLDTVCRQSYGSNRFEVIVVDDDSTDTTSEVVNSRMRQFGNLRMVRPEGEQLKGKSRALSAGIAAATGEVIMITDADCRVPETWVAETARRFDPDVGLVSGLTLQDSNTRFGAMQSLDWSMLLGIAASSVAWGTSFGSIGNNLSLRKKAYEDVGGYAALPFSVTEDYTLVQAIRNTKKWAHLYPLDPKVLVESQPCHNWSTLIRQKRRWGKGGLDVKFVGFLVMALVWLVNVLPLVHTLVWGAWAHTLTVYLVKSIADYVFLYSVLSRLQRTDDLRYFALFELYYTAYVTVLPLTVLLGGKVRWKGRAY